MPKWQHLLALIFHLSIPVVLIAGVGLFLLIDPELAQGRADYVRDYRRLEWLQEAVLMAAGGLTLLLWLAVCYLVLKSRQRSPRWLLLAAAGPLGFSLIAMLEDRSPQPDDRYQRLIRTLPAHRRVPLELFVFGSIWSVAWACVMLNRELMMAVEAFSRGTSVTAIMATQIASSGMWAFAEGLETAYLAVLFYLLWPIVFNLAARLLKPHRQPTHPEPRDSGG